MSSISGQIIRLKLETEQKKVVCLITIRLLCFLFFKQGQLCLEIAHAATIIWLNQEYVTSL